MPRYVPEAGDIVRLHFDPQAGHEQAGHRPALVLGEHFGRCCKRGACRAKLAR